MPSVCFPCFLAALSFVTTIAPLVILSRAIPYSIHFTSLRLAD